jgi:hypothetical protein
LILSHEPDTAHNARAEPSVVLNRLICYTRW